MTFSRSDFLIVRWNAIALAISILLSTLMLYGSNQYFEHAQTDFRAANSQMRDARNRLNNARMDQEYLATYSKDYAKLESRKLLGDDHRLDWIEGLEQLRRSNLVIDFSYTISPQQLYSSTVPLDSGNFQIHSSDMKLHFDLLHEGQFFNFLQALQNHIQGYYQLNSCKFERVTSQANSFPGESAPVLGVNIIADCNGNWLTLKNLNEPT